MPKRGKAPSEAEIKREISARGGLVKVRTIRPDKSNPSEYAHVYVVRKAGPRGGHTIRGPIQKKG